jgi:glyoxylase-like metal-dependent hydrolase (beta-lactamase superfamily II)
MRKKEEEVKRWNIATFISHHLNPTFSIPYLVILSHCHYDHILGLVPFLSQHSKPGHVQILASNHDREFLEPYKTLEEHSLCNSEKITCPKYAVSIWARHGKNVVYSHPSGPSMILPIKTLWTPGHTPDSLSWFDEQERVVYVGDSLYTRTSTDTENAPWGPEAAAPVLFPKEGDIELWWESVDKVLAFVQARNEHGKEGKRVMLSAGHVTTNVDAETVLKEVKAFMGRVLTDKVDFEERGMKRGERFGMWVEDGGRFSLGAPIRVVEQGRGKIPRDKWTLE